MRAHSTGKIPSEELLAAEDVDLRDTLARFKQTGSPFITDGEQTKPSFATYALTGLNILAADGIIIPFADGHTRQLPKLTADPFRYGVRPATYLKAAQRYAHRPVKQAVISASALSLLYLDAALPGYPREAFLGDLVDEAERDNRYSPFGLARLGHAHSCCESNLPH